MPCSTAPSRHLSRHHPRKCHPGRNPSLRLHLRGCHIRHCTPQRHTEHPRHLWSSHHKRLAAGKGPQWWKAREQGRRVCHRCHQDGEILNATTYRPVLKIPCRPVVDMRIADSCVLLLCRICSPKKTKNIKGNSEPAYTERRQNTDKSVFCCLSASLCKNEGHP